MNQVIKIFLFFIILLISFILSPKAQAQQSYVVKPALVIPKYPIIDSGIDYQTSNQDSDNQYRSVILGALKEVQQYYAQKLNGKTFIVDENAFQIIRPDRQIPLFTIQTTPLVDRYFYFLGGYGDLPMEENTIRIVWVLGTDNLIQSGRNFTYSNPTGLAEYIDSMQRIGRMIPHGYGDAFLNENNFIDLRTNDPYRYLYSSGRDHALAHVAHELGHAIGLVDAGYAKGHPCSDCSINQCTANAPQPLPSCTVEYIRDIMGYGDFGLHDRGFNNSIHNPEIYQLYRNPFINPQGDPPPAPVPSRPSIEISSVSPNPITVGQILEIKGFGFGNAQFPFFRSIPFSDSAGHTLDFSMQRVAENQVIQTGDYEILEWTDNLIRILIRDSALGKYGQQGANGITFKGHLTRNPLPGENQPLPGFGESISSTYTRNFYLTVLPSCNSSIQARVIDCSNGKQCSLVPTLSGQSCQWTKQCTDKTECNGLGTSWVGTSGCGNKDNPANQVSEQTQCANGQRCWADYYRDESTSCIWQPKINTEGEYSGRTYHCATDDSCKNPPLVGGGLPGHGILGAPGGYILNGLFPPESPSPSKQVTSLKINGELVYDRLNNINNLDNPIDVHLPNQKPEGESQVIFVPVEVTYDDGTGPHNLPTMVFNYLHFQGGTGETPNPEATPLPSIEGAVPITPFPRPRSSGLPAPRGTEIQPGNPCGSYSGSNAGLPCSSGYTCLDGTTPTTSYGTCQPNRGTNTSCVGNNCTYVAPTPTPAICPATCSSDYDCYGCGGGKRCVFGSGAGKVCR